MKKKKFFIIFIILLLIIIITFIIFKLLEHNSNEQLSEYTPQEELSDDDSSNTIVYLYFKNIETNTLIAEAKCIDAKNLTNDPYTFLINLLISGPESEKLESPIPEGTKVNSCVLKGNTLSVDLSKEFIDNAPSGIEEEKLLIYSIVNTLTELNEVSSVKFFINGEENLSFVDKEISLKNIFFRTFD